MEDEDVKREGGGFGLGEPNRERESSEVEC